MVRWVPAFLVFVPLEHREVGNPEEIEVLLLKSSMFCGVLLRKIEAQGAAPPTKALQVLPSSFGAIVGTGEDPQVVQRDASKCQNTLSRCRIIPSEALRIGHWIHGRRPLGISI